MSLGRDKHPNQSMIYDPLHPLSDWLYWSVLPQRLYGSNSSTQHLHRKHSKQRLIKYLATIAQPCCQITTISKDNSVPSELCLTGMSFAGTLDHSSCCLVLRISISLSLSLSLSLSFSVSLTLTHSLTHSTAIFLQGLTAPEWLY
jgi:hypothetical protein